MAGTGILKTRSLFPGVEKPARFSGFALLLVEEPCPLKPSNGFLNTCPGPLFFYHGILDANIFVYEVL